MINPTDNYRFYWLGFRVRIDGQYASSCGKILLGAIIGWPIGVCLAVLFSR